jgi:hypothetical protein
MVLLNTSVSVFNYRIEGELNGRNIDSESTNYSLRLNGTFKVSEDSRIQWTSFYRGPSVQAQGESSSMFFSNISYRQELMKKKLTATLSLRDVFGTSKFEGKTLLPISTANFGSSVNHRLCNSHSAIALTITGRSVAVATEI